MQLLHLQATEFHQLPSQVLIPRAPRWVQWCLNEAVLHWWSARDQAERAGSSSASADNRLRPVGTVDGQRVQFTDGGPIPWLEQDASGRWRRAAPD